jgi:hypothetical protein
MSTDNDKLKSSFEFKRSGVLQPGFIGVDLRPACRAIARSATAGQGQSNPVKVKTISKQVIGAAITTKVKSKK